MMTPSYRHLRVERIARHATTIWLNVADRKVNVFTEAVVDELKDLFDSLADSSDLTPIVIRSEKPSGFLAGADLRQLASFQAVADVERFLDRGQRLLDHLSHLRQPTVAAIHGACLGGGLELALACRHRIARDDPATRLGLPETLLGLTPAWGGTRRLPRLIGLEAALRMMLSGQAVDVAAARRLGLIDAIGRAGHFDDDLRDFVRGVSLARSPAEQPFTDESSRPEVPSDSPRVRRLRVMAIARRQCCGRSKGTRAQRAVLSAVDAGYGDAGRDEPSTVRADFACLVLSDECRQRLAEFFR